MRTDSDSLTLISKHPLKRTVWWW